MRILLLTVENNYHAPLLLRDMFAKLVDDEIQVAVSTRSQKLGLKKILKQYGWKYTVYKIAERLKYKRMVLSEEAQDVDFSQRRFFQLGSVLEKFDVVSTMTSNINGPESVQRIRSFQPDLIISLYFDQIIRQPILEIPSYSPLNCHPSLLPAYAGSSPTFWVLANGEHQTGITIHEMVKKVDAGRIVYQQAILIEANDTQFSLYRRCTLGYFKPLLNCIDLCREGRELPVFPARDDVDASYYAKVTKADIDRFLDYGRRFI